MMAVMNEDDLPSKGYILNRDGVDVIPSSIEMSAIEMNLVSTMSREYVLKTITEQLKSDYDYIIVDSAPTLTLKVTSQINQMELKEL